MVPIKRYVGVERGIYRLIKSGKGRGKGRRGKLTTHLVMRKESTQCTMSRQSRNNSATVVFAIRKGKGEGGDVSPWL